MAHELRTVESHFTLRPIHDSSLHLPSWRLPARVIEDFRAWCRRVHYGFMYFISGDMALRRFICISSTIFLGSPFLTYPNILPHPVSFLFCLYHFRSLDSNCVPSTSCLFGKRKSSIIPVSSRCTRNETVRTYDKVTQIKDHPPIDQNAP